MGKITFAKFNPDEFVGLRLKINILDFKMRDAF